MINCKGFQFKSLKPFATLHIDVFYQLFLTTLPGFGLINEGLTKINRFSNNLLVLAWLFAISESNLPGWMSIFEFILRAQAKKARKKGIAKQLIEKYLKF